MLNDREELLRLAWKHTGKNCRGDLGGHKSILVGAEGGGSRLRLLADFSADELRARIPYEAKRDTLQSIEGKPPSAYFVLAERVALTKDGTIHAVWESSGAQTGVPSLVLATRGGFDALQGFFGWKDAMEREFWRARIVDREARSAEVRSVATYNDASRAADPLAAQRTGKVDGYEAGRARVGIYVMDEEHMVEWDICYPTAAENAAYQEAYRAEYRRGAEGR